MTRTNLRLEDGLHSIHQICFKILLGLAKLEIGAKLFFDRLMIVGLLYSFPILTTQGTPEMIEGG